MKVDFVSGVQGRIANSSAHKCQNFFPSIDPKSKKPYALIGLPGLLEFCDTGYYGEVRGAIQFRGSLFAVVGKKLFKVYSTGIVSEVSGTLATSSGKVWMEKNLTQIMIVDGVQGYISTGTSLAVITDLDLPTPTSLATQDSYFICTVKNSDAFYISALEDGTSWDALEFASAEVQPDVSESILSDHRELWIFGEDTTEVFQNTGNSDFPFERIGGVNIERGILSGATAAKIDNSVFWLDNNGQVVKAAGYTPQVVSDRNVEYQVAQMTNPDDSHAYTYVQEGHSFYVLVFPTDGYTFSLDIESMSWQTRTSGLMDLRYRANCYCLFGSKRIVGDFENGKLYSMDFDTFDDSRAIARAMVHHPENKTIFHFSLEVEFEGGVGIITGDHSDPQAVLRYSDDHGKTWSSELWRDIGKIGEYKTRARWNKLGRSKSRIYEITLPGQHKKCLLSAYLNGEY